MTAAGPWRVLFTRQATRDAKKLAAGGLQPKVELLLEILRRDPFQAPPRFEKLRGDLAGACSRRIKVQHRLAKVLRMWTRYE
jgi:Txe/YoeB family toxin of toxin-antitoxin system